LCVDNDVNGNIFISLDSATNINMLS
jgi:hypothetical protein